METNDDRIVAVCRRNQIGAVVAILPDHDRDCTISCVNRIIGKIIFNYPIYANRKSYASHFIW